MKVVVARHEYNNGVDTRVFVDMASAEAWREELARDGWHEFYSSMDRPAEFDVDWYWDACSDYGDSWFSYDWYEVES